jgi:haloalkane dehalogenase
MPLAYFDPYLSMNDEWKQLYPFDSHFVEMQGQRMHYVDEGAGAPVICVHGNPTWSFYWRNLVLALRDRYRVIAVDHIGCGLSDKPAKYPYRLSRHYQNLEQLISQLDLQNATLVVHDWGGPIGLAALLNTMQRFRRVVLLNTGAYPPDEVPLVLRVARSPIVGQLLVQGKNQFIKSAFRTATKKPELWTPQLRAGYLAPYGSWSDRLAIYAFVRDIPVSPRHPTWNVLQHVESNLKRLKSLEVMMVWGMQDWCFSPKVLKKMRTLIPHAEVHEIDDAGHFVMEDAREQVIALIEEFLARDAKSSVDTGPTA